MLKSNKALSLLLALTMIFAFSANAFAVEDSGTVTLFVNGVEYRSDIPINPGDTVEAVVKSEFEDNVDSTWSGSWLISLTIDGETYASVPYIANSIYFDEDGFYLGGDTKLNEITEHGGVMMDASDLLGQGYFIMNDWTMLYLGSDWTFTIDYGDGLGPVTPGIDESGWWGDFYQFTMGEAEVTYGDIIYLDYDWVPTFFTF